MKSFLLNIVTFATLGTGLALANDYNESTDGDLPDDNLAPLGLTLELGSNLITSSQQGNAFGRDIDYFTIEIPVGMQLSQLFVDSYTAKAGNLGFFGIQAGTPFTTDASSTKASDLLGGLVSGSFDVGFDVLPAAGSLGGATGFTPPLAAGSYSFWMNQTGDPSTVALDFILTGNGIGSAYCTSNVNTTGNASTISAFGSTTVADNELTLVAHDVPVGTPGLFFFGPNQISLPFGEGLRCVGGTIQRLQPPQFGSSTGQVTRTVDLTAGPAAGVIVPSATTNFQYWYRDPAGGPSGFNTSNGVSVSWL